MDLPQATETRPERFPEAYRFLVVDDNQDTVTSMQLLLQFLGAEVRTAQDGYTAIEWAEQFLPHVVLLDLGLPRLNGFEVARRIRATPWGMRMVLLAVTGWCRDIDRERAVEAGFDAHIAKPVSMNEMCDLLKTRLERNTSNAP
jgi:CheY-like chemotaxis protein